MTAPFTTERIEAWLEAAPQVAPDRLRISIAAEVAATPQLRQRPRTMFLVVPLAAAVALVAVLIGQLLGAPTGDDTAPSDGASELLLTWPDQPDWFVDREPLPFCGESSTRAGEVVPDVASMNVPGRRCLLEAFRSGQPAEFVSVVEIPDRGPFLTVTRVLGPGRIEVLVDTSRSGGSGWGAADCVYMDDPRALRQPTEANVSDAAAEAEVFRVDTTSCVERGPARPTGTVTAVHPLEPGDRAGLIVDDAAWLVNVALGRIVRIELPGAEVTRAVDVGEWLDGEDARILMARTPDGIRMAVGRTLLDMSLDGALTVLATLESDVRALSPEGGRTWLTSGDRVLALDASGSIEHAVDLPGATGIAAEPSAIWAVSDGGTLLEIDPDTGDVRTRHDIGPEVGVLAAQDGVLYGWPSPDRLERLPDGGQRTDVALSFVRFDPETGSRIWRGKTEEGGIDPALLAITEDGIAAGFLDGGFAWLDPATMEEISGVASGFDGTQMLEPMAGTDELWVVGTGADTSTLYRVDPPR